MPRLVITADDCGLSQAINRTVYDLHQQGYVTAASVMPNFPAHRHALELLRDCPDLDLGAHLTLTDGEPVSPHRPHHSHLLQDDSSFRDKFSLYLRYPFLGASTLKWIRDELDAQLRSFTEMGIQPQHISTHHHFHSLPKLRRIVHELAADYRVDWVRGHDFRATLSSHNPFLRAQRQPQGCNFTMPDYMTALQANMSRPVEDFCARIARLQGTIEIVVHPSPASDPDFPALLEYGTSPRHAETEYLVRVIDRLRELGIAT